MGSLLSERLQAAIDYAGSSPASLAKSVGVTTSAILQILNGSTKSLKDANTFKIAKALRINAEWLALGTGQMVSGFGEPQTSHTSLSDSQRLALQLFDGLTESQQKAVLVDLKAKKTSNDKILEELLAKRVSNGF